MNRGKYDIDEIKKITKQETDPFEEEPLTLKTVIMIANDKKTIKSYRKRKRVARELLLQYLDDKYATTE